MASAAALLRLRDTTRCTHTNPSNGQRGTSCCKLATPAQCAHNDPSIMVAVAALALRCEWRRHDCGRLLLRSSMCVMLGTLSTHVDMNLRAW
jgi:hypothetical protein